MVRSESRLDDDRPVQTFLRAGFSAAAQVIVRNPTSVACATAFIVTLSFISGNALWNQKQPHASAFFITREMLHPGAVVASPRLDEEHEVDHAETRRVEPAIRPEPNPAIKQVQSLLADMSLYTGSVDGLTGPQTRKAIEDFQRLNGMTVSGEIDNGLLAELRAQANADPAPAPRRSPPPSAVPAEPVRGQYSSSEIEKVQAGLRAFGRGDIEIDGVVGSRTRTAISEFQTLFGLPATGEPDARLFAKMREIGLTN